MAGESKVRRERYWRGLWADWKASGQSLTEFCKRRGVAPSSFWSWSKRFAAKQSDQELPVFLPISLTPCSMERQPQVDSHGSSAIEILVAGRYQVKVAGEFTPAVLDSVITVLESRIC